MVTGYLWEAGTHIVLSHRSLSKKSWHICSNNLCCQFLYQENYATFAQCHTFAKCVMCVCYVLILLKILNWYGFRTMKVFTINAAGFHLKQKGIWWQSGLEIWTHTETYFSVSTYWNIPLACAGLTWDLKKFQGNSIFLALGGLEVFENTIKEICCFHKECGVNGFIRLFSRVEPVGFAILCSHLSFFLLHWSILFKTQCKQYLSTSPRM